MRLRHEFHRSGGGILELQGTDVEDARDGEIVNSLEARMQASGGPTDAAGTIAQAIVEANPTYFTQGTLWLIWNADDTSVSYPDGRCIWGGSIDEPPEPVGGGVRVHAEGHGRQPDSNFKVRLFQSFDTSTVSAGDAEPHSYDQDPQIEADVNGRRLKLGWKRKTLFLRATGETTLDGGVDKGDGSITVVNNAGGLAVSERIWVGEEEHFVGSGYTPGDETIPLAWDLERNHANGSKVQWRANDQPESWSSGLAWWEIGRDIQRVAFHLELTRLAPADLQILRGTGPDGSLTLVDTIDCSSGALNREIDLTSIAGTPDLIYFRLKRTVASDENGADKSFWAILTEARVNTAAGGNTDSLTASEVVELIADDMGGDQTDIQASAVNMLPYDPGDSSDAEILHEAALITNRYWSRRRTADGTGVSWHFGPWETEWNVTQENALVHTLALKRWNVVAVPFMYETGQKGWVKKTASPDPFPGEEIVLRIPLDNPPPFDIAEAFAQNAADELSEVRRATTVTFDQVEDPSDPGVSLPASRVKEGHVLVLTNSNDLRVKVCNLSFDDVLFTADSKPPRAGVTGHPVVDKVIAQRSLRTGRGQSGARSTLGGFDLERPEVPSNVELAFKEVEVRGGKRHFDAILDWDAVLKDIDGNGTAIRRYVALFQPIDPDTGDPIDVDDGGGIHRVVVERQRGDDPANNPLHTRAVYRKVEHPHKWKWRADVFAEDVLHQVSRRAGWTSATKPAAFGPDTPTGVTLDVDQHWARAKWEDNDATELDADGSGSPNRKMGRFKIRLLKAGVQVYPATGWKKMGRATHARIKVHQPGSATYTFEVKAADHYGNESGVASATGSKVNPPTQTTAPTITFDRGGKKGIRAKVSVPAYGQTYLDDDIDKLIVQFQAEENNPVDGDPRERRVVDIDPADLASAIIVPIGKIKAGEKVRARYGLKDRDDHFSGWSNWSTTYTAAVTRKPGAVQNLDKDVDEDGKFRTIHWKWTPPIAWSDATTAGWAEDEVAGYDLTPLKNDVAQTTKLVTMHKSTRFSLKVPPGGTWKLKVEPRGWDDNSVGAAATSATGVIPINATDGLVPFSSPAPSNVWGGIGVMYVYWVAIITGEGQVRDATHNPDPIIYEVHVSATTGFTPSAGTKAGETAGSGFVIRSGTPITLNYGTTYYVKLIAKDPDGSAAAGAQLGGSPTEATATDIGDIPGDQVHDGVIPSTPGTPALTEGYKSILASWAAVTNQDDPVRYEVHLSTSTGFTPSGSTIVADNVSATAYHITKTNAGTALNVGTTYYVKLKAKDNDGTSAASAQASEIPIGTPSADIIAGNIAVELDIIAGGLISVPGSGYRVELGNATYPIRYWNGTALTTKFTVDASGNVVVKDASITGSSFETSPASLYRSTLDGNSLDFVRDSDDLIVGYLRAQSANTYLYSSQTLVLSAAVEVNCTVDLRVDDSLKVGLDLEIDGALNHDGSTVGFYGVAPTTRQVISSLIDNSGGTGSDTLQAIGASYSQAEVRNNFADLADKVNAVIDKLTLLGLFS